MDKYEFNVKVEQIKKLINKGDYETAMKIADTIDWRRVRSTSLLTMVAQVYERNEEYQDAKDILLLAFERAPIGKGLLFKLTDLALREGNIPEAEAYYREFCDLSADDPRQNLLRYLILEAKGAPGEQLVNSLERYCHDELDEKWLYKLAELYHKAGREEDCVGVCDKIMLMFGLGKYVDKAMELKLQYAPLTKYQMDLVENREKYEEKLRAVELQFGSKPKHRPEDEDFDESYEEDDAESGMQAEQNMFKDMDWNIGRTADGDARIDEYEAADRAADEDSAAEADRYAAGEAKAYRESEDGMEAGVENESSLVESMVVKINEEEAEANLAMEMSRFQTYEEETSDDIGETRVLNDIRSINRQTQAGLAKAETAAAQMMAGAETEYDEEETIVEDWDLESEPESEPEQRNHLMIEAEDAASGLNLALESLKKIHRELGTKTAVAKISGENLNRKGIFAISDRLEGKDLIVERAADLDASTVGELCELMEQSDAEMIVVLIDTPARLEQLHNGYARLADKFQYIGCDWSAQEKKAVTADRQEELLRIQAEREAEAAKKRHADLEAEKKRWAEREDERRRLAEREVEENYPAEDENMQSRAGFASEAELARREYDEQDIEDTEADTAADTVADTAESTYRPEDDREMDVEEFAQYACKYASEIDCSISGKSMLALYERVEMMEEDGVPLTKERAEDLLEEAADKAEKHSFGGLFSSKYDKEGLLILKEKHFFD